MSYVKSFNKVCEEIAVKKKKRKRLIE